jgi:putative endonuclease
MNQMTTIKQWWVYLLSCADGTLYTGITTDLTRRVAEHNGIRPGGARYTAARKPVHLVYAEVSATRSTAGQREYQLRTLPRSRKLALVATYQLAQQAGAMDVASQLPDLAANGDLGPGV